MSAALGYLPLLVGIAVILGWRAIRKSSRPPTVTPPGLVQLRPRAPGPDAAGLLALAGLGFALALALVLLAPSAAVCLSGETCPEGPALWVGAAGFVLLGLTAAIAWPALTRPP